MSTQKLPIVGDDLQTRPRVRASATAMPEAAEVKLRTARPAIWVRYVIVFSPR